MVNIFTQRNSYLNSKIIRSLYALGLRSSDKQEYPNSLIDYPKYIL